jgi:hypothetical protein
MSKSKKVKPKIQKCAEYLERKGSITSWQAITMFRATRLSAYIHTLRKKGWDIVSDDKTSKNEDGQKIFFTKYIFVSKP